MSVSARILEAKRLTNVSGPVKYQVQQYFPNLFYFIPVSHFIIDFRSILFNEKLMILKGLRHADTKVQFTEFDFAKLIFNINKKFTNAIEN